MLLDFAISYPVGWLEVIGQALQRFAKLVETLELFDAQVIRIVLCYDGCPLYAPGSQFLPEGMEFLCGQVVLVATLEVGQEYRGLVLTRCGFLLIDRLTILGFHATLDPTFHKLITVVVPVVGRFGKPSSCTCQTFSKTVPETARKRMDGSVQPLQQGSDIQRAGHHGDACEEQLDDLRSTVGDR